MRSSGTQLGDFLRARRELVQPEQVGLPRTPGRRVPGLRREEVAALAGISPDYYLRIEQGRDSRPSDQVVRALSRALLLDGGGRAYLLRLARPRPHLHTVTTSAAVGDGVRRLLDQWSHTPAYVSDAHQDILASNDMARAFAPGLLTPGTNLLESAFDSYTTMMAELQPLAGDDEAELISAEWDGTFRELIAALRFQSDPDSPRLQEIVGRLSTRHRTFRRIWAEHGAKPQTSGVKRVDIEPFGWIDYRWQTLEIPEPSRQYLTTFWGDPGTQAAAAIAYLSARISAQREGERPAESSRSPERAEESTEPRTISVS